AILCVGFFFVYTTRNDNLWMDLETIPYRTETVLYATDSAGNTSRYAAIPCTQHKEYVPGEQIPQHVKDAFVAIEDHKFYEHWGFDFKRTVFAVTNEVVHIVTGNYIGGEDGRKQGASTITQQLVKNLTRDDEGSKMAGYMRKARELCRAVRLDALYSKEEILNAYLNTISFTGNTAGVQTEAKKLFGKTVDQLTIAEGASLAAITNSPGRYSPVNHPEAHLERRNYVLYQMRDQDYISAAEYEAAVAEPLNLSYQGEVALPKYVNSWFTDTVISYAVGDLLDRYSLSRTEASNLIYNGGLHIYTTVDPSLQRSMEEVYATASLHPQPVVTVTKQLTGEDGQPMVDNAGKPVKGEVQVTPQAAMVSLNYDGGIAGIAGGLGQKTVNRPFNRATSAYRQVGSTMKPIGPYVTALEDGWITWSSAFPDKPATTIKNAAGEEIDWPANADNTYLERDLLVREGIARSVNTTAVWVGRQSGNRRMYSFLHEDVGITSLVRQDANIAPLALGATTYGISPMEMAMAYAMFGNGGSTVTPHCYSTIESGTGIVLVTADTTKTRVISEETAFIMNKLLMEVVDNGTAAGMWVPGGMESGGKTGTTNDKRDHWFVGLTPYYVTASWYGYDDNLPLEAATGAGHPPTAAWRAVMQAAQAGLPAKNFPEAKGVTQEQYCTVSGRKAGANCPAATGWYKWHQGPDGSCPVH
ncbi:penicillin-binding protein, partial [Ruminococcaceae bacterium OttesenSCG-928-D13]|nr:penicillin-binding protein [Ruminococcaceae bacterium OttesenSCG-928-D13]